MVEESATDRLRFALGVAALFAIVTAPRLLAHELWRDEAWMWLVVIDSNSFAEMSAILARNGQGYFFPALCYLAKQVSASPPAMQFVNLALASSGAFAFARWAPFARPERLLFVLGYFSFYEYAVISRHYAAGSLLLWLACAASGRKKPALALGVALGLLCQTTVYGFILALALAAGWLVDRWWRRAELPPLARLDVVAGLACALAGGVAGLVQLIPEPGTTYAPGWRFSWQPEIFERVLQMPWRAFALLPRPELHFWNSNLLDPWPTAQAIGGVLLLCAAVAFLWPSRAAVACWLVGAAGLAGFGYIKFLGVWRHDGHWWLLFTAALWLAGGLPAKGRGWRRPALYAMLLLHAAVGLFASFMDLRHPFSNAERTARLLREQKLDQEPLLGYREPPAAPVALYLGQGKSLYSPSRGIYTRFPDWGPLQRDMSPEELRCAARELATREGRDLVLVINGNLPPWPEVHEISAVLGAIQPTEDYHLYRLHHHRLAATAGEAGCPLRP